MTVETFSIPSEFTGLRFIGVAPNAGPEGIEVAVKIQDSSSSPEGGACVVRVGCNDNQGCYDDYGVELFLINAWQSFSLPFLGFTRLDNFGISNPGLEPVAFDPSAAYQIAFQVGADYGDFDVWGDNVGFTLAASAAQ